MQTKQCIKDNKKRAKRQEKDGKKGQNMSDKIGTILFICPNKQQKERKQNRKKAQTQASCTSTASKAKYHKTSTPIPHKCPDNTPGHT